MAVIKRLPDAEFEIMKVIWDCNCQAGMGQFEQRKFPRLYPIAVKK